MQLARLVLVAFLMTVSIEGQPGSRAQRLVELRDRARPLLIFAPSAEDPQLQTQIRCLQQYAADARDREILPVALPYTGASVTDIHFTAGEAEALRHRFRIKPTDFTVLLVGKDGGEKLRASTPFSMKTLIATIDAMPMRRDEVRVRQGRE